jgi:hypothetical protein
MKTIKHKLQITLLIFFTASLFSTVFAQDYEYVPFPTQDAIWSEYYFSGEEDGVSNYERFALNGEDTTINNLVYKKLYLFYDTVFSVSNATYFGGIREDSTKRIYFTREFQLHDAKPPYPWYEYEEIVLFDFSLNIGDTMFSVPNYDYMFLVVKDIDTIQIANTYRKVFYFENYFWLNWIEGIGSNMGLLFISGDLPNNGLWGNLICFKQNNEVVYLNGNECMPLISGVQSFKGETLGLEIYPNPASQIINITFPSNETGRFCVYNEIGKIVYKTEIYYANDLEITLPCLNSGLYHVVFII